MFKRYLCLCAMLVVPACCAFAAAPLNPEALQPVQTIIAAIDLEHPESSGAAEELLVKGGEELLPAINEVLAQTRAALKEAETTEAQLGKAPLLQAQVEVLDRAGIRLTWKINPPLLIAQWCKDHVAQLETIPMPPPMRITDTPVANNFPDYLFYVVRFRQYPVARILPPPLAASNVFVVSKDGTVELLKDQQGQETFFKAHLRIIMPGWLDTTPMMKHALYSWLRIAEEFAQDGMFRFTILEEKITVVQPQDENGKFPQRWFVSGEAVVEPTSGNSGSLEATLTFDGEWKLIGVEQTSTVKHGIRPICQATKLLDPDAIVRRMAEQDLLFMGRDAESYIMEQRAEAVPALQAAIDALWAKIVAQQ